MGGDDAKAPRHIVHIDAFYMDIYAVTNSLYGQFIEATDHAAPDYWTDPGFSAPDQPVVGVNWHDAVAYAEWAGKRLPTEAEWEKAARGGLAGKRFPWGDDITLNDANYGISERDKQVYTLPVGNFAPNGYGLYDMAGNVWEWCLDWYDEDYYASAEVRNPQGPDTGEERVLRGGSWDYPASFQGVNYRLSLNPLHSNVFVGFRCAR